jgi:UDP-N-acetylmuramyl pentapeptide synthase
MNLNEIQKAVKAEVFPELKSTDIRELLIDSRKVIHSAQAMFIAIKGSHRDGHLFLSDAYAKGVRIFLVHDLPDLEHFPEACFLKVPDTLQALQQLAAVYRQRFHFPVIGITGSNGKTIVPLSIWLMEPGHNLGIFEAGISQPGEMEQSEKNILPDIGIFTNIGEAHSEGFMNLRQKINEKLILFRRVKELIYCKDYPELNECIVQYHAVIRHLVSKNRCYPAYYSIGQGAKQHDHYRSLPGAYHKHSYSV